MSHQLMQLQSPKGLSQVDRIYELLRYRNDWVPLPMIMRLGIACHTRRIHELRKRGHIIEIRKEYKDGQLRTAYRLVRS